MSHRPRTKVVSDLVLYSETNIDIGGLGLARCADVRPDGRRQLGVVCRAEV
ncbi:MAG: hypothetical protein OXG64_02210 [Chloroflexi bacterium]|nr:hypothetical protein [Chloroflexota bacterium]MCY3959045.1 hypothetical protein [Chloroflexota bacterium]